MKNRATTTTEEERRRLHIAKTQHSDKHWRLKNTTNSLFYNKIQSSSAASIALSLDSNIQVTKLFSEDFFNSCFLFIVQYIWRIYYSLSIENQRCILRCILPCENENNNG